MLVPVQSESRSNEALPICRIRRRRIAVLLSVYGDESSDERQQRVFAVAGLIGSEEMWERLEAQWLERTHGIPFHANNCDSDRGDYENTPHKENKALYRDLTTLLSDSGLGGWGFV